MTPLERFNKLIALSVIFGVLNTFTDDIMINFDVAQNLPLIIYNRRMRKDIEAVFKAVPLALFVMSMKNVLHF